MGVKADVEKEVDTDVDVRVEVEVRDGRPYVAIPAFGVEVWGGLEVWRYRVGMEAWINKAGRALVTRGA